ncbi:MAG: toll/interleukin-1 receptor domain-containing protein [Pseudonocardiaceae bacterium]
MVDGEPLTRSCRVFLSFSRESPEHVERVSQLYELLRDSGVDAQADFVAAEERQDWARWIQRQVSTADRVLVIVSPEYKRRFEGTAAPGTGRGVQHEARFIREHLYKDEETGMRKFLPVLLPGATVADIPDVLQPISATNYVVNSLTPEGVRPLLRLLTGQPARVEQPLKPVPVLPLEQNASSVALRLLVRTGGRSTDDEMAWQLASSACLPAGVSAVDLGLVATSDGVVAVVPMVSGRDVLGRWIRALHQQLRAVSGDRRQPRVQARLGLHRRAPEADEEADGNLAAALANSETARIMLGAHAADLVVVASDEFHELVADRVVHFPAASAYRPFTMNRVGGKRCWVAVAGHSVCPGLPQSAPSSTDPTVGEPDASGNGSFSLRDNLGLIIKQGDGSSFHLGDVYGRKERRR